MSNFNKLSFDRFRNCVIRNQSGNFGYVGFVNGKYMGFKNIETVTQLINLGFEHITIGDDDGMFIKILASSFENEATTINLTKDSGINLKKWGIKMGKRITRTITNIKEILQQKFYTNNIGDILSDDKDMYIHAKDGKVDYYHCLTDNLKTITTNTPSRLKINKVNKNTAKIDFIDKNLTTETPEILEIKKLSDVETQINFIGNITFEDYTIKVCKYLTEESITNDTPVIENLTKSLLIVNGLPMIDITYLLLLLENNYDFTQLSDWELASINVETKVVIVNYAIKNLS